MLHLAEDIGFLSGVKRYDESVPKTTITHTNLMPEKGAAVLEAVGERLIERGLTDQIRYRTLVRKTYQNGCFSAHVAERKHCTISFKEWECRVHEYAAQLQHVLLRLKRWRGILGEIRAPIQPTTINFVRDKESVQACTHFPESAVKLPGFFASYSILSMASSHVWATTSTGSER